MLEQFDSESFDTYTRAGRDQIAGRVQALADPQRSPPTCTKTWFHQGPIGEEFGNWAELQLQYEYWSGDHGFLDHKEGIDEFLWTLPERRVRRDALRALRGSALRSELYALDATGRSDRPYTVVETHTACGRKLMRSMTRSASCSSPIHGPRARRNGNVATSR